MLVMVVAMTMVITVPKILIDMITDERNGFTISVFVMVVANSAS